MRISFSQKGVVEKKVGHTLRGRRSAKESFLELPMDPNGKYQPLQETTIWWPGHFIPCWPAVSSPQKLGPGKTLCCFVSFMYLKTMKNLHLEQTKWVVLAGICLVLTHNSARPCVLRMLPVGSGGGTRLCGVCEAMLCKKTSSWHTPSVLFL